MAADRVKSSEEKVIEHLEKQANSRTLPDPYYHPKIVLAARGKTSDTVSVFAAKPKEHAKN
jgi:chorismate mutase